MSCKYIDAHCHPNLGALKPDQDAVVESMRESGVCGIVVGVDKKTSKDSVELAEKNEHLWATIGLHPNDTPEEYFDEGFFDELAQSPKVVGIGECGLDYFRLQRGHERADALAMPKQGMEASSAYFRIKGNIEEEKERQWEGFKLQVEFALKHDLPLMIHCRPSMGTMDAYEDMLEYLEPKVKEVGKKLRGNMHFFVGNVAVAKRFWAIGFSTSFTGVLTFTEDYDEVVKEAPLGMILTETDAPYAAPVPHRGKRNEPAFVPLVVEAIARIRGENATDIQKAVLKNAERMFGLRA